MATTISSPQISFTASAQLTSGAAPAPLQSSVNQQLTTALTVGSSAGNVGLVISEAFTVTSGTPFTIDVTNATDPCGNAVDMAVVTDIFLTNLSTTSGQDMTLGGAVTNFLIGAQQPVKAQTGKSGIALCGIELTVSSTVKVLEVTVAAGTSVAGQITIFGR
jgi:hypothetical protein